jgi:hypothetical protein
VKYGQQQLERRFHINNLSGVISVY